MPDHPTRAERKQQRRQTREARLAKRAVFMAEARNQAKLVGPLLLVTALAMYGQVSYALAEIAPVAWDWQWRILLAGGIAVAVESIALYVQWHAHDSLLNKRTLTAARQRRTSYLIALGVAAVNYSHFAGPAWAPTPAAVCFALFSAAGPWLWGLHTRRAQRVQLSREGQIDSTGAVFSLERFRWFPVRTLMAVRWSIDHGVSDPRVAWEGYNAERRAHKAVREAERVMRRGAQQAVSDREPTAADQNRPAVGCSTSERSETVSVAVEPERRIAVTVGGVDWPDRRGVVATDRDGAIISDLRLIARTFGKRPARDTVMAMYGIGAPKAERILGPKGLHWPTAADRRAA